MKNGFALITVLWLMAALGGLVVVGGASLSLARPKAENRLTEMRERWAARACAEIFRARFAKDTAFVGLDSVSLGPDLSCSVSRFSPSSRLPLNQVGDESMSRLLSNDSLVDAILDWRDPDDEPRQDGAERQWYVAHKATPPRNASFGSMRELLLVRGVTPEVYEWLATLLELASDGHIDPNIAPVEVLNALDELPIGGAQALVAGRIRGRKYRGEGDVFDALRAGGYALTAEQLGRLSARLIFTQQPEAVRASGRLRGARGTRSVDLVMPLLVRGAGLGVRAERLR